MYVLETSKQNVCAKVNHIVDNEKRVTFLKVNMLKNKPKTYFYRKIRKSFLAAQFLPSNQEVLE